MSEKIADDYGLTQLLAYLKAHAYTGGTNGTFALATDSDMDAVLTTGESTDWSDGQSVKKSIGYYNIPAWPSKGICNYVHVPGNSIIFEYMMNTRDSNIGQNGPVSQPSGACYVPYYLNAINKQIFDAEGYAAIVPAKVDAKLQRLSIKEEYDAHQQTLNEHCEAYKTNKDYTVFTDEDWTYAEKCMRYLGKSGSTESSWVYVGYISKPSTTTFIGGIRETEIWARSYYNVMNGAVYSESKAKYLIINSDSIKVSGDEYPKLKQLDFFTLLFGDLKTYGLYLAGGDS